MCQFVRCSLFKGPDADYRQELEELQDHVDDLEGRLESLGKEKADLEAQLVKAAGAAGAVAGAAAGGVAGDAASALAKYSKLKERYKVGICDSCLVYISVLPLLPLLP